MAFRPRSSRRRWLWLVVAVIVLLAGGAALQAPWRSPAQAPTPLDGKLVVIVRPPERAIEPLPVEQPDALPVRAGGIMSLEVRLNQPAYAYLVWLDCEGQVLPLYPWNPESLDLKDIHQPPPTRQAAKLVYSPLLGGGWTFGKQGGVETVLLLARRTPLDGKTQLGSLLAPLPRPTMRLRDEVVVLGLNAGADSVTTLLAKSRGDEQEAAAADEPLRKLLLQLGDHFELIRAVRFAHEGQ
jgi:hypothetical protein